MFEPITLLIIGFLVAAGAIATACRRVPSNIYSI